VHSNDGDWKVEEITVPIPPGTVHVRKPSAGGVRTISGPSGLNFLLDGKEESEVRSIEMHRFKFQEESSSTRHLLTLPGPLLSKYLFFDDHLGYIVSISEGRISYLGFV
jgi:hypothetical protein